MAVRIALDRYPGMSRFVLDWMRGDERAVRFLPRVAAAAPGRRSSREGARRSTDLADALVAANRRYGINADLATWARGETTTIVAGQQVGFAGGPLYTLAKIATVVRMKRDLEKAGTPVTAMFWLATEDHDYDEVAQLCVPARNRQTDLVCIRGLRPGDSKRAVGPLPIPQTLADELLALYPMQRPRWLREGITFGDSFAELIAGIFGSEIVLVDSLLPELRRAGKPLFDSIVAKWDTIERAIATRSRELTESGYEPQVTPRSESYSLLFTLDEHFERHLVDVPRPDGKPERMSTSALTRPLLQDFVLQPDIFVGGPAEVSYYAQIAPLHELLGIAMPRVALRGHALVAPKRVVRFIERYGIDPTRLFARPEEILAEREPEGVAAIAREASQAKTELMEHIEKIGELALPAEHSLARRINRSIGHIEYHFGKLTERAIAGLVRKDRERYAAVKELVSIVYPDGHVQDRIAAWFPYWHEYGQHFVDTMIESIDPDAAFFEVIGL